MERRRKLIEKMAVFFEHREQIAPVAARLFATLVLKGRKGETFDNLVCELNASKSTISTHLTVLQASNRVTYYTKTGDRKKYFILSPNALILNMQEMIQNWTEERSLHLEIAAYKKEANEDLSAKERFDLEFHDEYIDYLNQAITMMDNLKKKLLENHKND